MRHTALVTTYPCSWHAGRFTHVLLIRAVLDPCGLFLLLLPVQPLPLKRLVSNLSLYGEWKTDYKLYSLNRKDRHTAEPLKYGSYFRGFWLNLW
jgi:hypothetical protein